MKPSANRNDRARQLVRLLRERGAAGATTLDFVRAGFGNPRATIGAARRLGHRIDETPGRTHMELASFRLVEEQPEIPLRDAQ